MSDNFNKQLVMISGESASGKSASLRNIKNQDRWLYLNCEAGKRLPFRNKFETHIVTDHEQIYEAFDHAQGNGGYDGLIIDTLTFLLDMAEKQLVHDSNDSQKGWGNFAQYFKNMMQDKVASSDKAVIFMAHTRADLDEAKMERVTAIPVKGSLKNNGIEAYFSTVVSTKKMPLKALEKYQSDLLHITEQDEMLGFKHVFQTQLTKETVGERIRSPMGMFTVAETFMDNDAQLLLDRLADYYS